MTFVELPSSNLGVYEVRQETLLLQRDRATRLSVEILQLQNIPFKKESWAYRVALFA